MRGGWCEPGFYTTTRAAALSQAGPPMNLQSHPWPLLPYLGRLLKVVATPGQGVPAGAWFTLTEAAAATGKSWSTIKKYLSRW